MKAILFDFGGTLDTNGVHWCEKFAEIYSKIGLSISKNDLRDAFSYSERMVASEIKPADDFVATYKKKVRYQLKFLHSQNLLTYIDKVDEFASFVAKSCYSESVENIGNVLGLLSLLKKDFKLGLVSNYYGNLAHICKEFRINKFFDIIIDSSIVGIRKPDEKIYQLALKKLCVDAQYSYAVGDSYEKDIVPTKLIGCTTIWLKSKSWNTVEDDSKADYIIKNISEVRGICLPRKISL